MSPNTHGPIPQIVSKIPESETTVMNLNTSERPENDKVLKTHNDDDQRRKPMFLFSVDYILNKAGETSAEDDTEQQNKQHFDWLYCTRFKPPKLDRIKRKDGQHRQKRRPGRNPRIPFTTQQVTVLEHEFRRSAYLGGTNDVHVLSDRLRLSESRIKIWFQNRRARERRDHHSGSLSGSSSTNSTNYSSQQQRLPISSTSAFKPLMPSHTYVEGNDSSS
ncbi:homeobox protein MSX-1 [Rhopalosiphum padi]|uniref:homeobox protein MSX-1 n=1 Tax=Rhopalosiphum padi TaxID=40932 RepID=UPI00298E7C42|nr:homeobox protein MSX-1 [Rhopalosiphum padi]